ncbi:unnamed protein product [Staurois parvus]|uniref:AAA+ ATPase domain-containing protein n=1 Tax=Staurois parvus TaxID=386267 RepID=A0ABN9D3Z4_9NEOB|nr:unnamed protein product [Staurois parvus]
MRILGTFPILKSVGSQNRSGNSERSLNFPSQTQSCFNVWGLFLQRVACFMAHQVLEKTLLARAVASQLDCNFLKVVSSSIVDKYIGESARLIREMFNYARDHQPCIIFMDEIDAIGGRRFSEGTSADREIQRTLMELLNQMDGFDTLHRVKMIMATNRPDTLDPALLRPGRLDRKIHIELPNEQARLDILKIHAGPITKHGEIDYEAIVKLSDGFNGADLRNVCTEAGMFAIRADRDFVVQEDFMKAVRKVADSKKLESKLDYKPV